MEKDYGLLLNEHNIKLSRMYFKQMTKLIGINVIYRSPKPGKSWTTYAEIDSNYNKPIVVGCIFNEHPDQRTMKKLGWVSELTTSASIISVPYDLPGLQVGSLFIVPGAIDHSQGRLFMVSELSTIMIYPTTVTCNLVPEYIDNMDSSLYNHKDNSFNILNEESFNL